MLGKPPRAGGILVAQAFSWALPVLLSTGCGEATRISDANSEPTDRAVADAPDDGTISIDGSGGSRALATAGGATTTNGGGSSPAATGGGTFAPNEGGNAATLAGGAAAVTDRGTAGTITAGEDTSAGGGAGGADESAAGSEPEDEVTVDVSGKWAVFEYADYPVVGLYQTAGFLTGTGCCSPPLDHSQIEMLA